MAYTPRSLVAPEESFFLFGPRGTGKSTWIKYSFPKAFRIDLLDGEQERTYAARPEKIQDDAKALPPGSIFCIDEIQRVPSLLPMVHLLIEEKRNIQTAASSKRSLGGKSFVKIYASFYRP
jgi:predicted AAA+ superfamily ATPase